MPVLQQNPISMSIDDAVTQAILDLNSSNLESRRQTITSQLTQGATKTAIGSASWVWSAASTGQPEILETLASCGIDLNVHNEDGKSAFERLFHDSKVLGVSSIYEVVAVLARHNRKLPPDWPRFLMLPSALGSVALVKAVFDHIFPRLNVEQRKQILEASELNETPLMKATLNGHPGVIGLLLQQGANPECISASGWTPLLHAASAGSIDIVDHLLGGAVGRQIVADVNFRSPLGLSALHLAVLGERNVVIERLLGCPDIKVDLRDNEYRNALSMALSAGRYDLAQLIRSSYGPSSMSEASSRACESFNARIIEFVRPDIFGRVALRCCTESIATVLNALSGNASSLDILSEVRDVLYDTRARTSSFTWIHLPANNSAWIESILARLCFEGGPLRADGYDILLKALGRQSAGTRIHSRQLLPEARLYDQILPGKSNFEMVWFAVPFLRWNSLKNVKSQQQLVERVANSLEPAVLPLGKDGRAAKASREELLIRSYQNGPGNLHLRRTLDQYRRPSMATSELDDNQVAFSNYRGQHSDEFAERKVFAVDQLWLIALDGIILTCCPQISGAPTDDPLDTFEGIWNDVQVRLNRDVSHIHDLVLIIISRCVGLFDRHLGQHERNDLKLFEQLESSVSRLRQEADLIQLSFVYDLQNVTKWLDHRNFDPDNPVVVPKVDDNGKNTQLFELEPEHTSVHTARTAGDHPSFFNRLIDISRETQLHFTCLSTTDTLTTLSKILTTQHTTLTNLLNPNGRPPPYRKPWATAIENALELINQDLQSIENLHSDLQEVTAILKHLLEMKSRHASAIEARFARDQSEDTARQGEVILIFTVVTIIFLPLSFMASFFAIPIAQFSRVSSDTYMTLGYVAKYVFGIGLGFSVALIASAFMIGDIKRWISAIVQWHTRTWLQRRPRRVQGRKGSWVGHSAMSVAESVGDVTLVGEKKHV